VVHIVLNKILVQATCLNCATVSQFTLLATTKKGNKPDFHKSAPASAAKELYDAFFQKTQSLYRPERVKDGVFQAMMDVGLINDGPVGVDYTCQDSEVTRSAWSLVHPNVV